MSTAVSIWNDVMFGDRSEVESVSDTDLADPNPVIRGRAVEALGLQGNKKVVRRLLELLKDGDSSVVADTAIALVRLNAKEAVPVLVTTLGDKPVNEWIIWAVGKLGDRNVIEPLTGFL